MIGELKSVETEHGQPFLFPPYFTVRNYKDLDRDTAQTKRNPPCITQQIAIQLLYQWRPDSDWITQTVAIRQNVNNAIYNI